MVRYSLVVRLLHSLHLAAYPGATPSTPHRTGCSLVLSQRSQRELRPLRTSSVASPHVLSPDLRRLLSPGRRLPRPGLTCLAEAAGPSPCGCPRLPTGQRRCGGDGVPSAVLTPEIVVV